MPTGWKLGKRVLAWPLPRATLGKISKVKLTVFKVEL